MTVMDSDSGGWDSRHPRLMSVALGLLGVTCWYEFVSAARTAAGTRSAFPWGSLGTALIAFGVGYASVAASFRYRLGFRGLPRSSRVAARAGLFVVLSAAAVVLAVLTFALHDDATRSSRVQHGGLARSGTITSVTVNLSNDVSDRYGEHTVISSVDVVLRMDEPVQGVVDVKLHVNGRALLSKGQRLDLLVDPRDPTYVERAGHPLTTTHGWVFVLLGSLVAWGALVVVAFRSARRTT